MSESPQCAPLRRRNTGGFNLTAGCANAWVRSDVSACGIRTKNLRTRLVRPSTLGAQWWPSHSTNWSP